MTGAEARPGTGASPDGLRPLREVIEAHDLGARKSLGQNFILDLNLTRKIARAAGPLESTTVVEIGPGPGGLTRGLLLEGARRVIAVEADTRCRPALDEIAAAYETGRLHIHMGDALEVDWTALLGETDDRVVVAANLPYNIATRLLIGWLETEPWPPWFASLVLMFQKEVAERIVAVPRTKAYGRLAVISQWRCQPRIVMGLGPEAFTPPPKISSAVVELVPRRECVPPCNVRTLGRVTAAAFSQRRKTLRQSLKSLYREPLILLDRLGIDAGKRAEELTPSDFATIAVALDAQGPTAD
jgi:16S rRNA (adenine1518-N6/adenine1519-N6)-dimethyltransferase